MDAVKFLKARKEMCQKAFNEGRACMRCEACTKDGSNCIAFSEKYYDDAVKIVEKWVKNNPKKTRLQDFLEKFPNAKINDHGFPKDTCCMCLGYCESCDKTYPSETDCYFCWKKQLED